MKTDVQWNVLSKFHSMSVERKESERDKLNTNETKNKKWCAEKCNLRTVAFGYFTTITSPEFS